MNKLVRLGMLGSIAVAAALALSTGPAVAATPAGHPDGSQHHKGYVCTGGEIPSGTYDSLTVTGTCAVAADAVIRVDGNVTVRAGATLDAQSAPATILVDGNVTAAKGSLLGLGCQPDFADKTGHPCTVEPSGHSTITVKGNITTTYVSTVLLNGIKVTQNVTLIGGGGPIPWSVKNNTIGGNLTISGQRTNWLGVLFNTVGRNVTLTNIALSDPDPGAPGVYVVRNTIRDNLICFGLTPGVSGGFVPGEVNVVGRHAIGQCASLV